jgi:S-adenosylmethionine-diacylgycerolhomoserine-N-methlytransferase
LEVAKSRFAEKGWNQAEVVKADATQFRPEGTVADVVTFSYSLTMIPDWFAAIENALAILKPGGHIGVVDFYVGRKFASQGLKQHHWLARNLWQPWFAIDNVFPSPDHLPFLQHHFDQVHLFEDRSRLPYVPFLRTPYYRFIGRKPQWERFPGRARRME